MSAEAIFEPLKFRNLEIKNRILRSNISGRFDDYDGAGTQTRINWELKFARGGVGAILSAWTAVDERGKIVPSFAGIESDERVPFWRELGERVHEHDCRYILQLAHAGPPARRPHARVRQGPLLDEQARPAARLRGRARDRADLEAIKRSFAAAPPRARGRARRRRDPRRQRLPLHAVPLLGDQRPGGRVRRPAREPRAPPARDGRGDPAEVGHDFHVQVKVSTTEHANAFLPWLGAGNTIEDSVQVCRWLEEAGADAIHVSSGSTFPAPREPGRRVRPRGHGAHLRRHALERQEHVPQLPPLPALAGEPRHAEALGARPGRRARTLPARRAPREEGGRHPGDRHRRVPAGVADRRRHRARRLRRRLDRARARGQQRPRRALPGRPRPAAEAVHVLQQVPLQRARAPARLLRRAALRLARGDDRADHVRLRPAA